MVINKEGVKSTLHVLPDNLTTVEISKIFDSAFVDIEGIDYLAYKDRLVSLVKENPSFALVYLKDIKQRHQLVEVILLGDAIDKTAAGLSEL